MAAAADPSEAQAILLRGATGECLQGRHLWGPALGWHVGFEQPAAHCQPACSPPPPAPAEYQPSRRQPQFVAFELTVEQGLEKFLAWQRSNKLTPGDLLRPGSHNVRAVLLPYWLFSAQAHVRYTGVVGTQARCSAACQQAYTMHGGHSPVLHGCVGMDLQHA